MGAARDLRHKGKAPDNGSEKEKKNGSRFVFHMCVSFAVVSKARSGEYRNNAEVFAFPAKQTDGLCVSFKPSKAGLCLHFKRHGKLRGVFHFLGQQPLYLVFFAYRRFDNQLVVYLQNQA